MGSISNHHIMGYINDRKVPQFISSCETKSQPSSATHSRAVRSTNDWSDIFGAMFLNFGNDQNAPLYFSTLDSKFPSGVQLESNNTISLQIELVNYNTESREVYIVLDVEYLPGIQRKDVQSVLVNVSCWKPMPVDKTKEYRLKSQELVIQEDGTLLNARGHLHDGMNNPQYLPSFSLLICLIRWYWNGPLHKRQSCVQFRAYLWR